MKIQKRYSVFLFIEIICLSLASASVDTVNTFSLSMNKWIKAVVIKPADYNDDKKYPVTYLLHGYSGNYADWLSKVPALKDYADSYKMLIVCPDGGFSSWYFDSPIDSSMKYETYIAKELVKWIDSNYKTIDNRNSRAITGLSMGGHGALFLAFRHQNVFGAAGSTSGGVDLRPFTANWDISKRIGEYFNSPDRWANYCVVNLTHLLKPNALAIIFDCGTDDFFYGVNVALHEKLMKSNIPHDFISRPGGHTNEYWANSIKYQLMFMSDFFKKNGSN